MIKKRGFSKFQKNLSPSTFKIQITSMVDVFIILLVFLLKSFSTSPVQINPNESLTLPSSNAQSDPEDILKLIISKSQILIEEVQVLEIKSGKIIEKELPTLQKELLAQIERIKTISQKNETIKFEGKILVQADEETSFQLLEQIMLTCQNSGFTDIKFAVISK